jgi:hypothetical protein
VQARDLPVPRPLSPETQNQIALRVVRRIPHRRDRERDAEGTVRELMPKNAPRTAFWRWTYRLSLCVAVWGPSFKMPTHTVVLFLVVAVFALGYVVEKNLPEPKL